jgi:hypothetical protein
LEAFISASALERNPHLPDLGALAPRLKGHPHLSFDRAKMPRHIRLKQKLVNRKILRDCSKNAKKQMTTPHPWASFSSQKRQGD